MTEGAVEDPDDQPAGSVDAGPGRAAAADDRRAGPGPVRAFGDRVAAVPAPRWVLAAMVGLYVAVFGHLTWAHHANFGTFGFDMGIYDQGIWLLSRFEDPFLTVRGLHYFGHHFNLITVVFVPFYWLGAGPSFLYLVETVALAAGAVPIYLLARDRFQEEWLAVVPAAAWLLYPSVEWINWWHFHPDALIVTPLLFAYWLADRHRWTPYWVALVLALAAKEDAAMAVFVLGLLVAWRHDRRRGLATSALGVGWFLVVTRIVIPVLTDGRGPFYDDFFADFGEGSTLEIARSMASHPTLVAELLTGETRIEYYGKLLAPVAGLPLLAVPTLAIGLPQLLVNALSSHGPTHEFRFHYTAVVAAAVLLATVEGIAFMGRRRHEMTWLGVGVLAVSSVTSHMAWAPSPLGGGWDQAAWQRHPPAHQPAVAAAKTLVPEDAGVAATYYLVPQLTHRRHIYEWPNPFVPTYWGVAGEDPHPAENADYLVLDLRLLGDTEALLDRLLATDYDTVIETPEILVARRAEVGR